VTNDMVKIICMVRANPAQIYFLNTLNEKYKVSLAIIESPRRQLNLLDTIMKKGIFGSFEAVKNRVFFAERKRKREARDYDKYFDNKWERINENIPTIRTDNINSETVLALLKKENPDLILNHGTSIVKDHIVETSRLALNLHWGLSPYYRGSYCTEWALLNWDPHNIGVTIHKLAKEIDGGDILAQKRAYLTSEDTAHSVNMRLTKLGVELLIKAIKKIGAGEELNFKKQDYSLGFMTRVKQWNRHLFKRLENIENNGLIQTMLEKPAREQKLPIVEF